MTKRVKTITVSDKMQRGYGYVLTAPAGSNFDPEFLPGADAERDACSRRLRRKVHD